jgi:hypothetical protein
MLKNVTLNYYHIQHQEVNIHIWSTLECVI